MDIPKGKFGQLSKIEEELLELKDAVLQSNKIMTLVELSDLYCAIEEYLNKEFKGFSIEDLKTHAIATRRAFQSGVRKCSQE